MPPDDDATARTPPARPRAARPLRVIAAFKLAQAALLAGVAFTTFHLIRPSVAAQLQAWLDDMPHEAQEDLLRRGISRLLDLPTGSVKAVAGATLLYALLFTVEGIGLWRGIRWAEWLTVCATASFIPLEIWETVHRPGILKVLLILVNLAVVWYLIRHLRSERLAPGEPAP
jgi:uncharacterized membrane protein (DUF2068 family)